MNKKERIMNLIKDDIVTPEEGLVLLESISNGQNKKEENPVKDDSSDVLEIIRKWQENPENNTISDAELKEDIDEKTAEINKLASEINDLICLKEKLVKTLNEDSDDSKDAEVIFDLDEKIKKEIVIMIGNIDTLENAFAIANQLGEKMSSTFKNISDSVKQTIASISEALEDTLEWKDISIKIPTVATTTYEHQFLYKDYIPHDIDLKLGNGKIYLKTWDETSVKVDVKVKQYGSLSEEESLNSLSEKINVEIDMTRFLFHIPSMIIYAELTVYLPEIRFNEIAITLQNSDLNVENLRAKTVKIKSKRTKINLFGMENDLLEINGFDGDIEVKDGDITDLIIEVVKGNITTDSRTKNLDVSVVNGDVKVSTEHQMLRKAKVSNLNGEINFSLPKSIGLEGNIVTRTGKILSKLPDCDVIRKKGNRLFHFRRIGYRTAQLDLFTATGTVYLKNSEQS